MKKKPITIGVALGNPPRKHHSYRFEYGSKKDMLKHGMMTSETWFDSDATKDELAGYLGESLHTYLRYRWQWIGLRVAWFAFMLLCAFSLAALVSA